MSHSVTVTRTTNVRTTTSTTSVILFNIGFFKTLPGLLKLFEFILGIVAVGISAYCFSHYWKGPNHVLGVPELFFLIIASAALIATGCLVIASAASVTTASILPKTLFEVIYHGAVFILYAAASINYLIVVCRIREGYYGRYYHREAMDAALAAAVLGIILSILYLLSTIYAVRSYRRG